MFEISSVPKKMKHRYAVGLILSSLVLGIGLSWCAGCANPYRPAWQTIRAVQVARDATHDQLKQVVEKKHRECLAVAEKFLDEASQIKAYRNCIGDYYTATIMWNRYVGPATRGALLSAVTALQIAQKNEKKVDVLSIIRPAICALIEIIDKFKHLMPSKARSTMAMLKSLSLGVCDDTK